MQSTMVVNWAGVILMVAMIALPIVVFRGRSSQRPTYRAPRARSPRVRMLCALAAATIVVAIGVSTWVTLQRIYRPLQAPADLMVKAATLPAPPIDPKAPPPQLRYLIDVVVAESDLGKWRAIHVETVEFHWPKDKWPPMGTREFRAGDYQARFTYSIQSLSASRTPAMMSGTLGVELTNKFQTIAGSQTKTESIGEGAAIPFISQVVNMNIPMFSIVGEAPRALFVFANVRRVDPADPLKDRPLSEVIGRELTGAPGVPDAQTMRAEQKDLPPGFALAAWIGFPSLLLLVAAALMAQCFRWRSFAFAGALLAAILYIAALENMVMHAHAARLHDPASSPEQRRIAAERLPQTFFFRATAARLARNPLENGADQ